MDPVINSLVQSPLVRSMSTVPSKASSFVHGVRDNVPPFSFQKVVVQPWNNPSKTSQDQSHKFRLPQFGTLNRAYLRINMNNTVPTVANTVFATEDYNTIFDPSSSVAKVSGDDGEYTAIKEKFRIPWVHDSQIRGEVLRNGAPFGAGGGLMPAREGFVNERSGLKHTAGTERQMAHGGLIVDPANKCGTVSNGWNVCNILDEMRLTTNGKLIETVYGETIPAEVVKMPGDLRDFYTKGMLGYKNGGTDGTRQDPPLYNGAWDPSACMRGASGLFPCETVLTDTDYQKVAQEHQHASFIVPVTLSSLKSLSKNYQTRFVEDLELEVKMKDIGRGFNEYSAANLDDATKYHSVELVLIYHNWHDNIENTIRNSNYKRGVPASVYSTNWVRAATTAKVVSDTLPLSIPLTSRNLVTEMVVVARSKRLPPATFPVACMQRRKSDYTIPLGEEFHYTLELTGSGKTIWSASSKELQGPDSGDYDLSDRRLAGGDAAFGGRKAITGSCIDDGKQISNLHINASEVTTLGSGHISQSGVDVSFGDNMAIMRFGFQTTDEFYSGGIALQTISNPTVKITPPALLKHKWTDVEVEFDVYVKHANLVRIDSDTGAVSRTLDV